MLTAIELIMSVPAFGQPSWVSKPVGEKWVWFEDYAFAWATYTLACSAGCTCQAGLGVKAFGRPRGEKLRFSGLKEVLTVGFGAIHIRRDSGNDCAAAMTPGKFGTVPIANIPW
jgi:hypothetical protein